MAVLQTSNQAWRIFIFTSTASSMVTLDITWAFKNVD